MLPPEGAGVVAGGEEYRIAPPRSLVDTAKSTIGECTDDDTKGSLGCLLVSDGDADDAMGGGDAVDIGDDDDEVVVAVGKGAAVEGNLESVTGRVVGSETRPIESRRGTRETVRRRGIDSDRAALGEDRVARKRES